MTSIDVGRQTGIDLGSAEPQAILGLGPQAGVTYLVAYLKNVKICPLVCSAPSKMYLYGADFGSTIALTFNRNLSLAYILLKNKLEFLVVLFFTYYIFTRDRVAALENIVSCWSD